MTKDTANKIPFAAYADVVNSPAPDPWEEKVKTLTDMMLAVARGGEQAITLHFMTNTISVEADGQSWELTMPMAKGIVLKLTADPNWGPDDPFVSMLKVLTEEEPE